VKNFGFETLRVGKVERAGGRKRGKGTGEKTEGGGKRCSLARKKKELRPDR